MSDCGIDQVTLLDIPLSLHYGSGYEFGGYPPSGISMICNNTIENAQSSTQNIRHSYDKTIIIKEKPKKGCILFFLSLSF